MIKIDLHTHSAASHDGGISAAQYSEILDSGLLDMVAITDHGDIDFALKMHAVLGQEKIIVGQEIMTTEGEIIGLFLSKLVEDYLSPEKTIAAIKDQGGLVYIPHPFENVRKGVSNQTLDDLADEVDIIETINGRAISTKHTQAAEDWSQANNVVSAASSDAHGMRGLGYTYTELKAIPSKETLVGLLQDAGLTFSRPPLITYLYPKFNRLKKVFKSQS